MGLFSSIGFGALGKAIEKPFRTGASAARRQAKDFGEQTLADQTALKERIAGIYNPFIDTGSQSFQDLAGYYSGDQQAIIDQALSSPLYENLAGVAEEAVLRNQAATGGFRSGTTQENLAQVNQNALTQMVDQILSGKGQLANVGIGSADALSAGLQNIIAGQGATRGQIANIDIQGAADKRNLLSGLAQLGTQAVAAFSDERLKDNIVKIGIKNDLNWYEWEWNDKANELGLNGKSQGHLATEVELVRPDLVGENNGYKTVNYEGF